MIKEFVPLRFILALMIVFHHIAGFSGGGAPAVSFFFVLSGFCMMIGYKEKVVNDSFDYFEFEKRRLLKLYPLHLITLSAVCLLNFSFDKVFIANFFLIQSWIPDTNYYFSYNGVAWYLSSAVFSYLMFPLFVMFLDRLNKKNKVAFLIVILTMYCTIVYCTPTSYRHSLLYINPVSRLIDFVIGIYLAYMYNYIINNCRHMTWCKKHSLLLDILFVLFSFVLFFIGVFVNSNWRSVQIIYWLPICICVLYISITTNTNNFISKFFRNEIIQIISRCSFSLMMWHCVISMCPIQYNYFNFLALDEDLFSILLKFCLSYLVAQISYSIIEIRMTGFLNKILISYGH